MPSVWVPGSLKINMCQPQMAGPSPSPTPRLCAAIVDRLTFGGNIIETGTDSCRLGHTRAAHQT
jgi:hypothetical protein